MYERVVSHITSHGIASPQLCALQIACEGMVVEGPTEVKIFEGVKALHADAVVVGYHEHGLLARYATRTGRQD